MIYVFTEFSIGDVPSHVCKKKYIVIYWDAHNPFKKKKKNGEQIFP